MHDYAAPFAEGDWVQLRKNGRLMTVRFTVGHLLLCAWLDEQGGMRRATYHPKQLALVHTTPLLAIRVLARLATRCQIVAVLRT